MLFIIIKKETILHQLQDFVQNKSQKADLCRLEPQEGIRLDEKHGEVAKDREVVHLTLTVAAAAADQGGRLPHRPLLLPLLLLPQSLGPAALLLNHLGREVLRHLDGNKL